ncbi:hypothetical protein BLS_003135 [Venturia inaequalis]|uniref:Uncharacterized protein n=1 Tax=Venturia inaequalis TaxID=5025 RepID=A0A8H3VLU2_VENIN|nr:hypothetical protein BLS_003135 [Venturia inaequalis]KAE9989298.1 hypothetical protein EG327_002879 [Venturia inaequalis]
MLWLLTFILLALELHQFLKQSFLATTAVLDICLVIYLHWRPRNDDYYSAIENKVALRFLTLILCIAVFFQLLSHSLLFAIPACIFITIILYLHPNRTIRDTASGIEAAQIPADNYAGWHPATPNGNRDLEKGRQTPTPSKPFAPQHPESSNPKRAPPTCPYTIDFMRNLFQNRRGIALPPPMKEIYLQRPKFPIAKKREDTQRVGRLEDSTRALLDRNLTLETDNQALQTDNQALQSETERRVLPDDPIIQRAIEDAALKKAEQLLANPQVQLELFADFCRRNGLDVFRADGSRCPDLNQLVPGVTPPRATTSTFNFFPPAPPATTTPTTKNVNGGFDFGGSAAPPASGIFGTPSNGVFGGSAPTTTPGGFGAPSNPPTTPATPPLDTKMLTVTFRNEDPSINTIPIPFLREKPLIFCQIVYRNDERVDLGHSYDCTFHHNGFELDKTWSLRDFPQFQNINDVTIDVRPATSKPPRAPKGDIVVKFVRIDNPAATPEGFQITLSRSCTFASQERNIEMNSRMPFMFPENVTFDYEGVVLEKNTPISEIALLRRKGRVEINVDCSDASRWRR